MPADTYQEFRTAAEARLRSARTLWSAADGDLQHLSSACYLAGYTVEMLLKAAVIKFRWVKKRGKPKLSKFTETRQLVPSCPTCGKKVLSCPHCTSKLLRTESAPQYKHHRLAVFVKVLQKQPELRSTFKEWYPKYEKSAIFTTWDPELRYDSVWLKDVKQANDFMKAVCDFYQTITTELGQGATI